ncbi:MAG: membrane protein insertase YidC [Micavibrio aeruginosavorus]|uniref:Membrane protein insertase YidC n=1 Tax=Micavibrio aeruginosavorus TaxID=349221 RepID=A0A7T5UH08_9BACT|nr:MAG: membrane protein insertase YidC [Micavibrio aeruginosavorus]
MTMQKPTMNSKDQMHPEDRRNLMIFLMLALVIWFGFDHFIMKPRLEKMRAAQEVAMQAEQERQVNLAAGVSDNPVARSREAVLADAERIRLHNGAIEGTLPLTGNRFDDISLSRYFKTLGGKDKLVLLQPTGTESPQYVEYGWLSSDQGLMLPGKETRWRVEGTAELTHKTPVTMVWDNGQGLRFKRVFRLSEDYMVHVTQSVMNNTGKAVTLFPYALVGSYGMPDHVDGTRAIHEGPIGYIDGKLTEYSYKDMAKKRIQEDMHGQSGWIGITQKYWLTSLIIDQNEAARYRFSFTPAKGEQDKDHYQADVMGASRAVDNGQEASANLWIYAGAKEVKKLEAYSKELNVSHFDLAVDFGLFYFLTRPFFEALHFFGHLFNNFGVAIICLTVIIRILVFPLANASFRSFAKLKKISPMMAEIRERYSDNREMLQQELVKLYEKEKVNPMAGCLPILIQIPIFFALYKILMVTIEMRHAPFFGWIHDLSAMDPTTVFNLFGLLPYDVPAPLMIGAWPCIMMFFMVLQKYMNPPPQDKMQATMMSMMPYFLTYIMASFPAGLVVYWTFSNALSIVQQYIIMRSMNVPIHLFDRKKEKEMEKAVHDGPAVHPEIELIEKRAEDALFGTDDQETPRPVSAPKPRKKKKK